VSKAKSDNKADNKSDNKNFHWHVSGRHFRDYHFLLDEQAEAIFATTDQLAERQAADRQGH
jgi:DNA-binding ferritin-like protein